MLFARVPPPSCLSLPCLARLASVLPLAPPLSALSPLSLAYISPIDCSPTPHIGALRFADSGKNMISSRHFGAGEWSVIMSEESQEENNAHYITVGEYAPPRVGGW